MKCPDCGLEMVIWKVDEDGRAVYSCRNARCRSFDQRLKKQEPAEQAEENK